MLCWTICKKEFILVHKCFFLLNDSYKNWHSWTSEKLSLQSTSMYRWIALLRLVVRSSAIPSCKRVLFSSVPFQFILLLEQRAEHACMKWTACNTEHELPRGTLSVLANVVFFDRQQRFGMLYTQKTNMLRRAFRHLVIHGKQTTCRCQAK